VCEKGQVRKDPSLSNWTRGWFVTESRLVIEDLSVVPLNYQNGNPV